MRGLLHEHNTLNGFWFSLIEFLLLALVCLFLSALEIAHGRAFWSVAYFGIAANASAICATVFGQMRRGERCNRLAETYSRAGRERVRREHPDLDRHTLAIVVATLVPFLLAVLTAVDGWGHDRGL